MVAERYDEKNMRAWNSLTHQRHRVLRRLIYQNEQMLKGYIFYMGSYHVKWGRGSVINHLTRASIYIRDYVQFCASI